MQWLNLGIDEAIATKSSKEQEEINKLISQGKESRNTEISTQTPSGKESGEDNSSKSLSPPNKKLSKKRSIDLNRENYAQRRKMYAIMLKDKTLHTEIEKAVRKKTRKECNIEDLIKALNDNCLEINHSHIKIVKLLDCICKSNPEIFRQPN